MWHVSAVPGDIAAREAIVATLDLLASELHPWVATFFAVDDDIEIESVVAHGSHSPPAQLADEVRSWEFRLRGIDPLAPAQIAQLPGRVVTLADVGGIQRAVLDKGLVRGMYEQLGVIDDAQLLIRDGDRLVAGVSLWRRPQGGGWADSQLRLLAALQPLIELAYLCCLRTASGIDVRLPDTLTPRERQVARLLARGAATSDIARALFIGSETAKSHTHAVLTKVRVKSRRELVQRLGQRGGAPPASSPHGGPPGTGWDARVRLEGDEAPRRLLAAVLDWSAERIDATIGGCALFSARQDLAGEAYGIAGAGPPGVDPSAARLMHRHLLARSPSALVRRLDAAQGRAPVVELGPAGPVQIAGIGQLSMSLGMTTPLLAVLRRQGQVAGLVWLSRCEQSPLKQREVVRQLRAVHPLLELSQPSGPAERRHRVSIDDHLVARGLSERELEVARMALEGKGNTMIARRLGITESTVKKHMSRVLVKCGARSRTQLIALLGGEARAG